MSAPRLEPTTLAWSVVKAVREAVNRAPGSTLNRAAIMADAVDQLAAGLDPAMLRRMLGTAERVERPPQAAAQRREAFEW